MFEETLYQSSAEGKPFVDILNEQGIKPGIKVDTGLEILPGSNGETATQGLDGLGDRMAAYREQVWVLGQCLLAKLVSETSAWYLAFRCLSNIDHASMFRVRSYHALSRVSMAEVVLF